jgi:hypothetical protein
MMAQNLSENSTSVAPARIVQPPNEKVTNSGIQSENWQEMETPNNGEHRDQMRKKRGPEFECLWMVRVLSIPAIERFTWCFKYQSYLLV